MTRRTLMAAGAAAAVAGENALAAASTLAVKGGTPVHSGKWPSWPKQGKEEENALIEVLKSGHWGRTTGKRVSEFEGKYAALTGSRHCLATANGTSALLASLAALEVGPGDEVIIPPYTFVATLNAVMMFHALPVFSDTDRETFQMDIGSLEARATAETKAVVPVHLGGAAADMDALLPLAQRKGWKVLEDACQAHLGEWRGRKVGTLGDLGCFSFQASKNLNSGEGGAVLTQREDLMDRAYAFHSNGRSRTAAAAGFAYVSNGANLRLTEFQAVLLMTQMARLEAQARKRDENAAYLTKMLSGIPGITPQKLYPGCTRNAWHLYMFRYDPQAFAGVPRATFLKALGKEGVPGSGGYGRLNKEPFLLRIVESKVWRKIYGEARLKRWIEANECPANDRLCEEAVWFTQTMLLAERSDMEKIAEAIQKIQKNAGELKS